MQPPNKKAVATLIPAGTEAPSPWIQKKGAKTVSVLAPLPVTYDHIRVVYIRQDVLCIFMRI
jgi:2-keto-4-pentenoate hydratase/2-oxohepta-3-ene-1,7-dioic acid hydratase in catechol pathway